MDALNYAGCWWYAVDPLFFIIAVHNIVRLKHCVAPASSEILWLVSHIHSNQLTKPATGTWKSKNIWLSQLPVDSTMKYDTEYSHTQYNHIDDQRTDFLTWILYQVKLSFSETFHAF